MRFALLCALIPLAATVAQAQNGLVTPRGPVDTVAFETTEGTWMNLDVSPDGRWIVFDLLGDIYRLPIGGGRAELLSGGSAFEHQPRFSPDGRTIAFISDRSGADNVWLMDADGGNRRQLTRVDDPLPTAPMWMPDGRWIVVKRHVRSTRSVGGGELWLFHIEGGSGVRLRERLSFTSDINEPYPSPDGRYVYYSFSGPFDYNRNVHAGIFQISRVDRSTGRSEAVTTGPGGAVRPTVSRNGRWLAFVRRVGLRTVLVVRDLASGAERQVTDQLDPDQQETWAIHGVYPAYQWTPDDRSIVISYGGGIQVVDVSTGRATPVRFTAAVSQTVTRALRHQYRVPDTVTARMIRWPVFSPDGRTLVFQALGHIYRMDWPAGRPERLTDLSPFEFAPAFSADGRWLVFTTWDDDEGGHVWKLSLAPPPRGRLRNAPQRLTSTPNQYANPAFSPDGRTIAVVMGSGAANRGADLSDEPFLQIGVLDAEGGEVRRVTETPNRGAGRRMPRVRWSPDGTRLLFQENRGDTTHLTSIRPDGSDRRTVVRNRRAEEIVASPDGRWIAYKELHQVYVAPLPETGSEVTVEGTGGGVRAVQLSRYGGDWVEWRPDSRGLSWVLGPVIYLQAVADFYLADSLQPRVDTAARDWRRDNLRVRGEWSEIALRVPRARPSGAIVLRGARVITMRGDEVFERGDVVVVDGRVSTVAAAGSARVPSGARVVDVSGRTIIPGLVDVHAHMGYGALDITPQRPWQYWANLAYGVTTTHDPSASDHLVFAQSELVEAGMMTGPRIYSTGFVLYGAENPNRANVGSYEDARGHAVRHLAIGGFSLKSYNQMRRDSRQWIIEAAREYRMLVVPEGGSTLQMNLSHILDGHTTIEHAVPVAPLRADVISLWSRTLTSYTPTLIVGYGGIWGENYWYQVGDVYRNERLLRFTPRQILDARARRRMLVPEEEFWHFQLARAARDLLRAGGSVNLGAHGQLQGLGAHWEMWMFAQGGMSPLEVLRAATLAGAQAIGLDQDIGSIEPGKLADLVVLEGNPLEDIRQTERVAMVMINGVLYDADMNQIWPLARQRPPLRAVDGGRATGTRGGEAAGQIR